MKTTTIYCLAILYLFGHVAAASEGATESKGPTADYFYTLQRLCGSEFVGEMTFPIDGQDSFKGKTLIAEFNSCDSDQVRVSFSVGEDRSRTWVFSKFTQDSSSAGPQSKSTRVRLKHDHRHSDGTPDEVTNYGGDSEPTSSSHSLSFPADAFTQKLIPEAATNVWTVSISPDHSELRYDLTRHGRPRFSAVLKRQSSKNYQQGSQINGDVVIANEAKQKISLREILESSPHQLNVLYLFGGGAMGLEDAADTGGIWCPDSYADMRIFSELVEKHGDNIGFLAIAIPPAFHTQYAGFPERVFFESDSSKPRLEAEKAFIDSSLSAVDNGTIPIKPYFDLGFNLLISDAEKQRRRDMHPIQDWHGAFRAKNESQHYGVPSFWIVDKNGNVVTEPFRGNVHHPDNAISINFGLSDVLSELNRLKNWSPAHQQ